MSVIVSLCNSAYLFSLHNSCCELLKQPNPTNWIKAVWIGRNVLKLKSSGVNSSVAKNIVLQSGDRNHTV